MSRQIRVTIADDDLIVRAGLRALLETIDTVVVTDECGALDELVAAVTRATPDVVVTDIRMPPTRTDEGVQAARALRRSHPGLGVVVLSHYLDPQLALAVFEDGSARRGYLLKENVAEVAQLEQAIRSVAAGGSFIDTEVVDALVSARLGASDRALAQLSARELEVLGEMATGRSNGAIAERLFIGERAVEKHISSIFLKLDLRDDGEAHRRVAAVLLFLGRMGRPGPDERPRGS